MNALATLLALVAIGISALIVLLLVLWMKGADSIALPGLGLILATPLLILLLLVVEIILVILSVFTKASASLS